MTVGKRDSSNHSTIINTKQAVILQYTFCFHSRLKERDSTDYSVQYLSSHGKQHWQSFLC